MKAGDTVEIWMTDEQGNDLFGHIRNRVRALP
jgi:hypothetical protein